jgi:hypothetical protein
MIAPVSSLLDSPRTLETHMDKPRISKHIPFTSFPPSPLPGHIMIPFKDVLPQDMSLLKRSPQGLLTLSIAYSRTSPAPSLSFSPSGSSVKLHDALAIHYTFVASTPTH